MQHLCAPPRTPEIRVRLAFQYRIAPKWALHRTIRWHRTRVCGRKSGVGGGTEDDGGGAVIDGALGTHAPVDVVVRLRPVHRLVAIVAVAQTTTAAALAATVV